MKKLFLAAALTSILAALSAIGSAQEGPEDFDLPNGHFYKQANGQGGSGDTGFAVLDEGQDEKGNPIRLWSGFRALGAERMLGYPISRRFKVSTEDPYIYQAFQKALLRWNPEAAALEVSLLMDQLHLAGLDPILEGRGYPPRQDDHSGGDYTKAKAERLAWLNDPNFADLRQFYLQSGFDPETFFGLPGAPPRTYGEIRVLRLQRLVLASYRNGPVTLASIGEDATRAGYFSGEMLAPQRPDEDLTAWVVRAAPTPPQPPFKYREEYANSRPNCDDTLIKGTIRDTAWNPVSGVTVKVWNDYGLEFYSISGWSEEDGKIIPGRGAWERYLGPGPRPGIWHVAVVEGVGGKLLSPVSTVASTKDCGEGGSQEITLDYRANY